MEAYSWVDFYPAGVISVGEQGTTAPPSQQFQTPDQLAQSAVNKLLSTGSTIKVPMPGMTVRPTTSENFAVRPVRPKMMGPLLLLLFLGGLSWTYIVITSRKRRR